MVSCKIDGLECLRTDQVVLDVIRLILDGSVEIKVRMRMMSRNLERLKTIEQDYVETKIKQT